MNQEKHLVDLANMQIANSTAIASSLLRCWFRPRMIFSPDSTVDRAGQRCFQAQLRLIRLASINTKEVKLHQ